MKLQALISCLVVSMSINVTCAQDLHMTKKGHVKFFSGALIEDITATNDEVLAVIDVKKNEVAVDIPIKSFVFRKKLMREHFNENYLESEKFPKATFKGNFKGNSDITNLVDGTYTVTAKGELTIHGVKKNIDTLVQIIISQQRLSASFGFDITVKEYGVKVPRLMFKKIAKVVEVTANFDFEPYK